MGASSFGCGGGDSGASPESGSGGSSSTETGGGVQSTGAGGSNEGGGAGDRVAGGGQAGASSGQAGTSESDASLPRDSSGAAGSRGTEGGSDGATGAGSVVFPLKASSNKRYLVDQNGAPFLLMGDAPHAMFANLSVADATSYLDDRVMRGFNALWCELLINDAVGGQPNGSTYDGIPPFTAKIAGGKYDMTKPNSAYFDRVDQMVRLAAERGIVVFLDSFENDGWMATFEANGDAAATSWGQYIGNRYKAFSNVIWITGNDFQTWNTSATDNAIAQKIMAGIGSADANHLQTTELNYNISGSLDDALLVPYTGLAAAYTYYPVYYEVLRQYSSAAATVPVFLEESYYDVSTYGNLTPKSSDDVMLRKIAYWTVLSGGLAGYMYGSSFYDFHAGWQKGIDTTAVTELGYWRALLTSVPWYRLVPDQNHSVVTAGFGTATGNGSGNIETDNFVTTSATADGTLVMSYLPELMTITVDMTKLKGPARARWYDPTDGIYTTVAGSPFANTGTQNFKAPGAHPSGGQDWVLVIDS
jgi:hypothetical protein